LTKSFRGGDILLPFSFLSISFFREWRKSKEGKSKRSKRKISLVIIREKDIKILRKVK